MDSYRSVSFRKYASQAILLLIGTALMIAVYSTTATASPMFYSGHDGARKRVHQVWDRCGRQSDSGDDSVAFAECIDRYLRGIEGLYFAALVKGWDGEAGYSWNYKSLTAAFNRARLECRKRKRRPNARCTLSAFAVNGCIADAKDPKTGDGGYGVGPTKAAARADVLGHRDLRNCSYCKVRKVFCTAR